MRNSIILSLALCFAPGCDKTPEKKEDSKVEAKADAKADAKSDTKSDAKATGTAGTPETKEAAPEAAKK